MKRRRGYTLVESLVVIALTAVTLSTTAITMHALHRAEHRLRDDFGKQRFLNQFASQFRWDAHEASAAVIANNSDQIKASQQVTLKVSESRSIRYVVQSNRVQREVLNASAVEHRESFRLAFPNSYWTLDERDGRALLTLNLVDGELAPGPGTDRPPMRTVQAAIGLTTAATRKGG